MAQKIFTPFKAEIKSFELREAYAGVLEPGVYRGYDRVIPGGSANEYIIEHRWQTGYRKTQIDNTREGDISGILVMPSGMVVHDNGDVPLTLSALGGATSRTDAIIATLLYLETSPGAVFTYSIIEGVNPSTFVKPNPGIEVTIGFITLDSEGHTYVRSTTPNLAGKADPPLPNFDNFARRPNNNTFLGINRFSNHVALRSLVQTPLRVVNQIDGDGYILINGDSTFNDGNEFIFDLQGGTAIDIWGFKYEGWDFGGNPDTQLVPGTTIKVRFVNVGSGCKFKKYINQKGFWIQEDANIYEHVLYTIRMEQNADNELSGFTISPLVNQADLTVINQRLTDANTRLIDHITKINQVEALNINLATGWEFIAGTPQQIFKDYFGNVTIRLNLYQPSPASFQGVLFELPSNWLPQGIYTQSITGFVLGSNHAVVKHLVFAVIGLFGPYYSATTVPYTSSLNMNFTYKAAVV